MWLVKVCIQTMTKRLELYSTTGHGQLPVPETVFHSEFRGPPQGPGPGPFPLPDFTKPPPGFGPPPGHLPDIDLTPSVPYYELPAGLMAPLVKVMLTTNQS